MNEYFERDWIEERKQDLLNLRQILINRVKSADNIQVAQDEMIEEGDRAQLCLIQDVDFELRDQEIERLHEIECALQSMQEGGYGICQESGERISVERLERVPWARYTRKVQEEMEEREASLPNQLAA